MANKSGKAYSLTTLCPIINKTTDNRSYACLTRGKLQQLPPLSEGFLAKVPNTYLARLYILNDVFYQGKPAKLDHLKSKYLVFSSNFHGELEPYLKNMWQETSEDIKHIWEYCVAFNQVKDADSFVKYIKKCQVKTTFFFNGSNDDPLKEQLKSLYLKQEFSKFTFANQNKSNPLGMAEEKDVTY